MPLLSLFLTVVLCAVPVAQTRDVLLASSWTVVIPVVLLHSAGYALGYFVPKLLKFPESTARTVWDLCLPALCATFPIFITFSVM